MSPRERELEEQVQRLRCALESVWQYGNDTLRGPTIDPDDRKWHRTGVVEMTRRAREGLDATPFESKDEVRLALKALVDGLDSTTWSSWQNTSRFYPQLAAARKVL